MNLVQMLKDLTKKNDDLLAKAKTENRIFTDEEQCAFDANIAEMEKIKAMIVAEEKQKATADFLKKPPTDSIKVVVDAVDQPKKLFKNFAEQMIAVKAAAKGFVDERLTTLNASLGMNEGAGQDGGFAVQADFAGMIMDTAVKEDPILSRVDSYAISQKSDRVNYIEVDETDISSTVFGGVQVYWAAEADTKAASKPKIQEKELKLQKLMGFAYATDELNSDSTFVDQLYTKAFNTAIRRSLAAAIISGDGIGKPLGIKNSGALVSIAKETNQLADTIVWANLSKMYNRVLDKSKCVWLCHPDVSEQFDFLSFPVGTGGVPVYLPASASGSIDTLRGKPILESDHCSTLGDLGDIFFFDPSDYWMIYKGGVQKEVSIHVEFLTAQNCYRFIFRANGMPKRKSALTIKNSSNQRSSIVSLAARA